MNLSRWLMGSARVFLLLTATSVWSQPIPTYYMQEGRQVAINIDTLRIAVRLQPHLVVVPESLFASHRLLTRDLSRTEFYRDQKLYIVPLSPTGILRGIESVYDSLVTQRDFSFVGISVSSNGRSKIVLTNEVVAAFESTVTPARQAAVLDSLQLASVPERRRRPERLRLRPQSGSPLDAVRGANLLAQSNGVRFAQPNFIVLSRLQGIFGCAPAPVNANCGTNDPLFSSQWYLTKIGIPDAWCLTRGRPEVVIAVIDIAIDITHPDLTGNAVPIDPGIIRDFDFDDPDPRPEDPTDVHGTKVAGIAAARGNNGLGIAGVCPECRLLAYRAYEGGYMDQGDAILQAAKDEGAWVISNSWCNDGEWETPAYLKDCILGAVREGRGGLGTVVVFATPYTSCDFCGSPTPEASCMLPFVDVSALPEVISVGQSTEIDGRAIGSPSGICLDILAPGSAISTTTYVASSYTGTNGYVSGFGGSSAATPIVAGVVGLMLSANDQLCFDKVRELLIQNADKVGEASAYNTNGLSQIYGYGRINAKRAVQAALASVGSGGCDN